jgi:hypothetical protein
MHEFVQGCLAVAIHGGKDMEERIRAIAEFKAMKKDILGNNFLFIF